ncbi:MAG: DUF1476 domain-containing protein [Alphaproteobacteria bacterium]|jgi:hypothetical protein|nr:DUF1476 domain-containing protein [Alphaproteobacteria bacterium]
MNGFDNREKGFEAKYSVDQEHEFKVMARRNRLLGAWAAEQMGLSGDAIASYAKDVVAADFEKPGDSDVVEKVLKDFADKGIDMDEAALRKKMNEFVAVARQQLSA